MTLMIVFAILAIIILIDTYLGVNIQARKVDSRVQEAVNQDFERKIQLEDPSAYLQMRNFGPQNNY